MTKRSLMLLTGPLLVAATWAACAPGGPDRVGQRRQALSAATITVHAGVRQTFVAYGTSYGTEGYGAITDPAKQAKAADMLWKDLQLKVLRLWYGPCSNGFDYGQAKSLFYNRYVDGGEIADALSRGAELLLAPACGEGQIGNIPQLAKNIAQLVADLKDEKGHHVLTTGLANEPSGMSPAEVVQGVKLVRQELDARGLSSVQVIAPEWASADGSALACIDALKNDTQAWQALHGIATHSYNMAATEAVAQRVLGANKTYWQTESSDNGDEGPDNDIRAATTAARVLNDLNHMVTHWIWFIGWGDGGYYDGDGGTKLFVYDPSSGQFLKHLKYDYLMQLRQAFRPGAKVRHCTSSSEGEMEYSYGQKPALNAAAAQNADGSWALGVVNDTGISSSWTGATWYPAETYDVTFDVAELATAGDVTFQLLRSKKGSPLQSSGTLTMQGGLVKVTVQPRELVTLVSAPTAPPPPSDSGAPAERPPPLSDAPGTWPVEGGTPPADGGGASDDKGQRSGYRDLTGGCAAGGGGRPPTSALLLGITLLAALLRRRSTQR